MHGGPQRTSVAMIYSTCQCPAFSRYKTLTWYSDEMPNSPVFQRKALLPGKSKENRHGESIDRYSHRSFPSIALWAGARFALFSPPHSSPLLPNFLHPVEGDPDPTGELVALPVLVVVLLGVEASWRWSIRQMDARLLVGPDQLLGHLRGEAHTALPCQGPTSGIEHSRLVLHNPRDPNNSVLIAMLWTRKLNIQPCTAHLSGCHFRASRRYTFRAERRSAWTPSHASIGLSGLMPKDLPSSISSSLPGLSCAPQGNQALRRRGSSCLFLRFSTC